MKKNRILWCIWLVVLAILLILFRNPIALVTLVLSVILPLASFLLSLVGSRGIDYSISGPELLTKREKSQIEVNCHKAGMGIWTNAICIVEERNLFTGEINRFNREIGNLKVDLYWEHSGKIENCISKVKVMDLWGIFSYSKKLEISCFTDVIPDFFIQEIETSKAASFDMESVEYSTQKPGEDPSEIFDIREYEYGDSLKRIHWKLTSKYDEIMVMRPSLPIDRSIILFLDMSTSDIEAQTPDKLDALCEVFTSLSRNLIVQEMKHQICLYDEEIGHTFVYSVEDQQDFAVVLSKILGSKVRKLESDEDSLYMKYTKAPENLPFAHNVICTLNEQWEEDLLGGLCITQLIPAKEYSYYEESVVNKQIKFSEGYSEELFHIVI